MSEAKGLLFRNRYSFKFKTRAVLTRVKSVSILPHFHIFLFDIEELETNKQSNMYKKNCE